MKTLDEALFGLGYEHVRALSDAVGRAVLAHPTAEPGVERVVKPLRHPDTPALRGVVPYAQSLEHPALPRVWDVASSAGRLYLVRDHVAGQDLWSASEGRSIEEITELLASVCLALDALHERSFLHLGVHANNILVDGHGAGARVHLVDFSLTRGDPDLPQHGIAPTIVAPEVIGGAAPDERADLYALGLTFYTALTGVTPFESIGTEGSLDAHLHQRPADPRSHRPEVSEELAGLVMGLLAKDARDRPTSILEVLEALSTLLSRNLLSEIRPVEVGFIRPAAVVGRLPQMVAMSDVWRQVDEGGSPRLVQLLGTVGSGRSRLLDELQPALIGRGAKVVRTGAARGPLGALWSVLEQCWTLTSPEDHSALGVGLQQLVEAQSVPARSLERAPADFVYLITHLARRTPVCLMVDDVEALPPLAERLLQSLAYALSLGVGRDEGCRLMVVMSQRYEACEDLGTHDVDLVERLTLPPLGVHEVAEFLNDCLPQGRPDPELAAAIHAATGGRVFWILELVRALVRRGDLRRHGGQWRLTILQARRLEESGDLQAILVERLSALPEELAAFARAVAVAPSSVTTESLSEAMELAPTEVLDLCRDLHRRGVLLAEPSPGRDWRIAGTPVRQALIDGAGSEAELRVLRQRMAKAAGASVSDFEDRSRARRLTQTISATTAGMLAKAREHLEKGEIPAGIQVCEHGRQAAAASYDLAQALAFTLEEARLRGRVQRDSIQARPLLEEALWLSSLFGDRDARAHALTDLAIVEADCARYDRALEVAGAAIEGLETLAVGTAVECLVVQAAIYLEVGDYRRAIESCQQILVLGKANPTVDTGRAKILFARMALARNQLDRAAGLFEKQILPECEKRKDILAYRAYVLGIELALEAGQPKAAAALLALHADSVRGAGYLHLEVELEILSARLTAQSDPGRALQSLTRAQELVRGRPAVDQRARILLHMARIHDEAGDGRTATDLYVRARTAISAAAGTLRDSETRQCYFEVTWRAEVASWLQSGSGTARLRRRGGIASRHAFSARDDPGRTLFPSRNTLLEDALRLSGARSITWMIRTQDQLFEPVARFPRELHFGTGLADNLASEDIDQAVLQGTPVLVDRADGAVILPLTRIIGEGRDLPSASSLCKGLVVLEGLDASFQQLERLRPLQRLLSEVGDNDRMLRENVLDELTGLWSRQVFLRELQRIVESTSSPCTVVLLGVLGLDEVKLGQGRLAFSTTVRTVSDMLTSGLRQEDLVGRFAEDEFAVLLVGAERKGAEAVARRLRNTLRVLPFPKGVTISLSIGLAEVEKGLESATLAVDRAWAAMTEGRSHDRGEGVIEWCAELLTSGMGPQEAGAGVISGDLVRDQRNVRILIDTIAVANSDKPREEMLAEVLDRIIEFSGADRGILFLEKDDDGALRPEIIRHAQGQSHLPMGWSHTVPEAVYRTHQEVFLESAMDSKVGSSSLSIVNLELTTIICLPLEGRTQTIGVLYFDGRKERTQLVDSDKTFFRVLAREVARSLELAELRHTAVEKEFLDRDLRIAQEVHARLMPVAKPEIRGLDVAARTVPARELGGDYFDFFPATNESESMLVVGDVSGKGVGAALVVSMAKAALAFMHEMGLPMREKVIGLSRQIYNMTEVGQFMSAIFATWLPEERKLRYASGGHEHILIASAGGHIETRRTGGILLGLGPASEEHILETEIEVATGDALLLYTDGTTDARNAAGEAFGLNELRRAFGQAYRTYSTAEGMLQHLLDAVNAHQGEGSPIDDITFVIIRCIG